MKKLLSHSLFLQMFSVILIVISINNWQMNQLHKDLLSEVLIVNMNEMIGALEDTNIELIHIYMSGKIEDTVEINSDPFYDMDRISDEVDELLKIDSHAMRWYRLTCIDELLREMKSKESLSEVDMDYILTAHRINQELLNAYNEILTSYGIEQFIYSDKKKVVADIYKEFSKKGNEIISSEAFEALYNYETSLVDAPELDIKSEMTLAEAERIAKDMYRAITGEDPSFEVEESAYTYEFTEDWNINSNRDSYEISIYKDTLEVEVHLSAWGGEGQFSEERIDQSAKEYISQFVPETYVLYDKNIRFDENKIDSISYKLVYFDGDYYNSQNEIKLIVDNQGKLRLYNYSLVESHKDRGVIVEEKIISNQVKLGLVESLELVLNHKSEFEYQVKLKLDNTSYILTFDALTGAPKEVLGSESSYGNRVNL